MHCTIQKLLAASLITLACVSAIAAPAHSTTAREWKVEGNDNVHATLVDLELVQVDGENSVIVHLERTGESVDDGEQKDPKKANRKKNKKTGKPQRDDSEPQRIYKIPLQNLSTDEQKHAWQEYALILNAQRYSSKPRNWKNKNGKKVHAKFIDLEVKQIDEKTSEVVLLERSSDVKIFNVPLEQLSEIDQKNALRQAERKQSLDKRFTQKQKEASEMKKVAAEMKKVAAQMQKEHAVEQGRLKKQYELLLQERGEPDVRGVFWGDSPEMVAYVQEKRGLALLKTEVTYEQQKRLLSKLAKGDFSQRFATRVIRGVARQIDNERQEKLNKEGKRQGAKENISDPRLKGSKKSGGPWADIPEDVQPDEIWARVPKYVAAYLKNAVLSSLRNHASTGLKRPLSPEEKKKGRDWGNEKDAERYEGKERLKRGSRNSNSNKITVILVSESLQKSEESRRRSEFDQLLKQVRVYVSKSLDTLLDSLQLERHVRLHGDLTLLDGKRPITFFFDNGKLIRVYIVVKPSGHGDVVQAIHQMLIKKYGKALTKNRSEREQLVKEIVIESQLSKDSKEILLERVEELIPDHFFDYETYSVWQLPRSTIECFDFLGDAFILYQSPDSTTFLTRFYESLENLKSEIDEVPEVKERKEFLKESNSQLDEL